MAACQTPFSLLMLYLFPWATEFLTVHYVCWLSQPWSCADLVDVLSIFVSASSWPLFSSVRVIDMFANAGISAFFILLNFRRSGWCIDNVSIISIFFGTLPNSPISYVLYVNLVEHTVISKLPYSSPCLLVSHSTPSCCSLLFTLSRKHVFFYFFARLRRMLNKASILLCFLPNFFSCWHV